MNHYEPKSAKKERIKSAACDFVNQCLDRGEPGLYAEIMNEVSGAIVYHAFQKCDLNQTATARVLGINRGTVIGKLKSIGAI